MTGTFRHWIGAAAVILAAVTPAAAQLTTRSLTPIAAPPAPVPPTPQVPGEPPQSPMLRIDAPFHTQVVNRLTQDANGREVFTVSDDKTIRIWQASDGAPLGTLRVPIAAGDEGALYAVALSPDGNTLLVGGNTGYAWDQSFSIYFFDPATGRMKARLPGLPGPVNALAFSPDGKRVGIAMGNGGGVRLINPSTGELVRSDPSFHDRVTSVAFDRRGFLYATSFDGSVRCYDPAGRTVAERTPVAGGRAYSVAVSPDGREVAVGYLDQPRVELLNATDLHSRASLTTDPSGRSLAVTGAGLGAVAWGSDGTLFAAGSLLGADGHIVVRHWAPGSKRPADWSGPKDSVSDLVTSPRGGVIVASADPALMRLDRAGHVVWDKESPGIAVRDLQDRPITVSQDGMAVQLQTAAMVQPWTVDLTQRQVGPLSDGAARGATRGLTPVPAAMPPRVSSPFPIGGTTEVTDWRNSPSPKIDGHPLRLAPEELSRAYAVSTSGKIVLIGTDYRLRVYGLGGEALSEVNLPATVWSVGVSGDGRVAVAAVGDGTLRWFGLSADGQLTPRISVFLGRDTNRWVAWTPTGFFDTADTGGSGLAGLLLNRRNKDAPEWYSFAQLFQAYYNPDLVVARLRGEARPDPKPGVAVARQTIDQAPPPVVGLRTACWMSNAGRQCRELAASRVSRSLTPVAAAPEEGFDVTVPSGVDTLTLTYGLKGKPGTSSAVDVFVNGRNGSRAERPVSADGSAELEQTVSLSPGKNQIQLRAYDSSRATYSESRTIDVLRSQDVADEKKGKPNLYILAVGIDHYAKTLPQLGFAVADARAVARGIKKNAPTAYEHTELLELYDDKATVDGVIKALGTIANEATDRDTVVIYLSGHGDIVDQHYYFITQNVPDVNSVTTTALSEGALVSALSGIKSNNTMLFLDTCHAGAFSLNSAGNLAHETGRYILAGAQSLEEELDSYDNRNGIFATAILRVLQGQEASAGKNTVDNFDLGQWVAPLVKKLAQEKQHQQSARFKVDNDDVQWFPLAQIERPATSN